MPSSPRLVAALALALAGCVEGTPAPAPGTAAAQPAPPPSPPPSPGIAAEADDLGVLMHALGAAAVRHDAPVRTVLYTWTTREQAEELRARPVLLSREVADGGERSRFDEALAADRGPMAARLQEPGRRTRRFAWPTPWATVMGWDGQGYGPVLVRVALAPDAIVARFSPGEPWRFFAADGRELAEADALAAPERLAAVYHVAPPQGERPGFREFVLVQERAIAAWSLGSDDIRARIEEDAGLLERVADRIDTLRTLAAARCDARGATRCPEAEVPEGSAALAAWSAALIAGPWSEAPSPADVLLADLYAADLALPAAPYAPTGARLRAIAQRLRALADQPPPLRVKPGLVDRESAAPIKPVKPARTRSRCWDPTLGCDPPRGRP